MFETVSESERYKFFNKNDGCHIPGYTGHCPTLRFQYGSSYGSRTKEILQELKQKKIISSNTPYRYNIENENNKPSIRPINRSKGQMSDPAFDTRSKAPRYIIGYTGFIPTLNFRSGKSYGRTAEDCMDEFTIKQRKLAPQTNENVMRSVSVPKYTSVRNSDDVKYVLRQNTSNIDRFKVRDVTPDNPPIAGYTGHIPKVKGNEESLSQRYNNAVRRSMRLLKEERERNQSKYMKNVYNDENREY